VSAIVTVEIDAEKTIAKGYGETLAKLSSLVPALTDEAVSSFAADELRKRLAAERVVATVRPGPPAPVARDAITAIEAGMVGFAAGVFLAWVVLR